MVDDLNLKLSKEEADALIHIVGKLDYYLIGHLLNEFGEDVVKNTSSKMNSIYRKLVQERLESEG